MSLTKEEWKAGLQIRRVTTDKKRYLPLLLIGDEQESMIDRYLDRGEMFVMVDSEEAAVAVAVATDEGDGVVELKNLAVAPCLQRKGHGRSMVKFLCNHYKNRYRIMLVGTGDSRATVSFYENCGFGYSHTIKDFFLKNYDHPIIEEGKILKDMICFKRELGDVEAKTQ